MATVIVTADDLRRVAQVEQELASAGREVERAAVHKALALLRQAAIERLERRSGAEHLPEGRLPGPDEPPIRTLGRTQEEHLSRLLTANGSRRLTPAERRELKALLDTAEGGAMRNVLALLREHAPDSDAYAQALRAYNRSFARFPVSPPTAPRGQDGTLAAPKP